MLQLWDDDLLGMTLRYPYELKNAKDYFYDIADVKIDPKLLTLAQHIPKTKEARFDPTRFMDRYEQAVVEMLERKQAGLPAMVMAFAPPRAMPDPFERFRGGRAKRKRRVSFGAPATRLSSKINRSSRFFEQSQSRNCTQ